MQLLNLTGTGSASPWSPLLLFQGALGYRPSQQQYVPSEASAMSLLIQSFFNPLPPWYLWPPSEQCSIVHLFQAQSIPKILVLTILHQHFNILQPCQTWSQRCPLRWWSLQFQVQHLWADGWATVHVFVCVQVFVRLGVWQTHLNH